MTRHGHVGSALPGGARDAAALPAPVLVHANYCGVKSRCFGDRGLWLLPDGGHNSTSACAAYDLRRTKFAEPLWRSELAAAEQDLRALLADVPDGTVLQFRRFPAVYIKDGGTLRPVPNTDTLERLGTTQTRPFHCTARSSHHVTTSHVGRPGPATPRAHAAAPVRGRRLAAAAAAARGLARAAPLRTRRPPAARYASIPAHFMSGVVHICRTVAPDLLAPAHAAAAIRLKALLLPTAPPAAAGTTTTNLTALAQAFYKAVYPHYVALEVSH
jgi:hypothetical protein